MARVQPVFVDDEQYLETLGIPDVIVQLADARQIDGMASGEISRRERVIGGLLQGLIDEIRCYCLVPFCT